MLDNRSLAETQTISPDPAAWHCSSDVIWARGHREDPHRNYREACVLQYVFCCFGICVLEYVFCCFSIIFLEALEGAFFQTLPPEIWLGDRGVEEPTVASIPG